MANPVLLFLNIFVFFLMIFHPHLSYSLSLLSAFEKAKAIDPRFLAQKHEYQVFLTLPRQARAFLLPQISASYSRHQINYHSAPPNYFDYDTYNFRLNLQQPLFNLPNWVEYLQSKERVKLSEFKLKDAELDLMKRVSEAYFDYYLARERLKVLHEEKRSLEAQLKYIKDLFLAGEATLTDIHDIEARLSDLEFRLISAERDLFTTENNLARLIGERPKDLPSFKTDLSLPELSPQKLEDWLQMANLYSPILKYHSQNKEIARREISKQGYAAYPKVDLVASYIKSTSIEYLRTAAISYSLIGFQITLPLFTGGYITAKKEEAKERFNVADKDYERASSDLIQQIVDQYYRVRADLAKVRSSEVLIKAHQQALESTKKAHLAGLRSIVDIINAQSALYEAKFNHLRAKLDYLRNTITLKYLCGILTIEDLKEVNYFFTESK